MQYGKYFLLDLAVGGNFTDALANGQVTAPRPAKMYVDYVRVYEYDGLGQVITGNVTPPETGTFGVFTETTPTDNALEAGVSSDIWVWDPTTTEGITAPFEGSEVIAWNVQVGGWFGGGVQSRQARDTSNFADSTMQERTDVPNPVPNLYFYYKESSLNCRNGFAPIAVGDKLEFEISQFLGSL